MQFQCNDAALQMTTNFSDEVHLLHAFHLKFIINANIVHTAWERPVDSVRHLCEREPCCREWGASNAVLKVTVMRSEATVLECDRFIERQLNNYFCGKMWCSNY